MGMVPMALPRGMIHGKSEPKNPKHWSLSARSPWSLSARICRRPFPPSPEGNADEIAKRSKHEAEVEVEVKRRKKQSEEQVKTSASWRRISGGDR